MPVVVQKQIYIFHHFRRTSILSVSCALVRFSDSTSYLLLNTWNMKIAFMCSSVHTGIFLAFLPVVVSPHLRTRLHFSRYICRGTKTADKFQGLLLQEPFPRCLSILITAPYNKTSDCTYIQHATKHDDWPAPNVSCTLVPCIYSLVLRPPHNTSGVVLWNAMLFSFRFLRSRAETSNKFILILDIVAYRLAVKRWLFKRRPFLGNGLVNTFPRQRIRKQQ
jgi:hypothetical protein